MEWLRFESAEKLRDSVADLLCVSFTDSTDDSFAVMLSGGRTPLAAYGKVARKCVKASERAHVFLSDERMVASDSPESNYGNVFPMIESLGIPESRIIAVNSCMILEHAARDYGDCLSEFLGKGGRITLGLLGLGSDGHTASLFGPDDIERGRGLLAIPVRKAEGPSRVSVTRDLLLRVERIVLVVAGDDKALILKELRTDPCSVTAGIALEGHERVEVWTA